MLDPKLIKSLSKIYKYDNATIDYDKDLWTYFLPNNLSEKQIELLNSSGYDINKISKYQHDTLVKKLRHIVQHDDIETLVANLLIKAIGSGFHRGIQPILSYYFAKHLPEHDFESFNHKDFNETQHCKTCGLEQTAWSNNGENLYYLYICYLNLASDPFLLLDLEEVITFDINDIMATKQEKKVFLDVIRAIEQAPQDETLFELEQRLSKEKCLPKSNKSTRLRVLWCFAELGFLKNSLIADFSVMDNFYSFTERFTWDIQMHDSFTSRADPVFPASMWRGSLGVNREYVNRVIQNANLES